MEDFCSEENFGSYHRVFLWKVELAMEHTAFIGSAFRASNFHIKVSAVSLTRLSVYSHDYKERLITIILIKDGYLAPGQVFGSPKLDKHSDFLL